MSGVMLADGVAELLAAVKINSKDSTPRLLLAPPVLHIGHMSVCCMAPVLVEPGCQHMKDNLKPRQTDSCLIGVV